MVAAEATHKDSSDKQEANVEDDYDMVQLNLRSTETERDIVNMRTILSSFVPKLAQLKPEEVISS